MLDMKMWGHGDMRMLDMGTHGDVGGGQVGEWGCGVGGIGI